MKCFLVNCGMVQIRDLPHLCDLEPAEFFISQSENRPQQKIFKYQKHQEKHTCQIRCSSFGHFNDLFRQLYEIHKKCVSQRSSV